MFNDYSKKIENKIVKILKKMFGYKSLNEAFSEEEKLIKFLESECGKEICLIEKEDMKNNYMLYIYSKYRTLKSIIDTYIDSKLMKIYIDRYKEN